MWDRLEFLSVSTGSNVQEFKQISCIKDHSFINSKCDPIDAPDLMAKCFYISCMCMSHLFLNEQGR